MQQQTEAKKSSNMYFTSYDTARWDIPTDVKKTGKSSFHATRSVRRSECFEVRYVWHCEDYGGCAMIEKDIYASRASLWG